MERTVRSHGLGARNAFHVSIHDVEPAATQAIVTIRRALEPLIGSRLSMAVVPCWHGHALRASDTELHDLVCGADEVLLHGWTHHRTTRGGLLSWITGHADEFASLSTDEAQTRLINGRAVLEDWLGRSVSGFLAPAFRAGPVDLQLIAAAGMSYLVGWRRLQAVGRAPVALATSLWDVSPIARLGRLGEFAGRLAERQRTALPVVAIHPVDVERGHFPRALRHIMQLIDAGRTPILAGGAM